MPSPRIDGKADLPSNARTVAGNQPGKKVGIDASKRSSKPPTSSRQERLVVLGRIELCTAAKKMEDGRTDGEPKLILLREEREDLWPARWFFLKLGQRRFPPPLQVFLPSLKSSEQCGGREGGV